MKRLRVSIPFIAGQWSLQEAAARAEAEERAKVSIPFIAGQWSLLVALMLHYPKRDVLVSIPFIAGQWSLRSRWEGEATHAYIHVSIPFIAGQWSLLGSELSEERVNIAFQSPSLRGSGRFQRAPAQRPAKRPVSIPFIAGQWSLPPLARGWGPAPGSFNPLHCGAVVASALCVARALFGFRFQSPSLRGSGRFEIVESRVTVAQTVFQSPSLRGSGRFMVTPRRW